MKTKQIAERLEEKVEYDKSSESWSNKARGWAKRYLPAEIVSTGLAYAASDATYKLTNSEAYAAIAATHAGNLGYYGTVFAQDMYKEWRDSRSRDEKFSLIKSGAKTLARMAGEFGVSGTIDTLFTRPAITGACTAMLSPLAGRLAGVVAGKLASDAVFYSLTIPAYEVIKKFTARRNGRK